MATRSSGVRGGDRLPALRPANGEHYALLLEIANVLTTKLDPDQLFDSISQVLRRFVKIDRSSLALYDPDRDEFQIVALALHAGSHIGKGWSIPHAGSRIGKVFDSREAYLSQDVSSGARFFEDSQLLREGMHSSLVVPLLVDGEPIGSFNVNCRRESGFTRHDVEMLTAVGNQIAIAVANSRAFEKLRRHAEGLKQESTYLLELAQGSPVPNWVLNCPSMFALTDRLMALAKSDAPVLIIGESGTGKSVVARTIHSWGPRRRRPSVRCDCATLSPELLDRELFGQESGKGVGAYGTGRAGRLELANNSTLYLHEVAALTPETQAKLNAALSKRSFTRIGGTRTLPVDFRVIASSSRDLRAEISEKRFRKDLFEKLGGQTLDLSPLRERRSDILPLADHFLDHYRSSLAKNAAALSAASQKALRDYSWPGNVRELENVIERAVLLSRDGSELEVASQMLDGAALEAGQRAGLRRLADVEADYIRRVLKETRGRVSGPKGAARILGLNASTLRSRMLKLGIEAER